MGASPLILDMMTLDIRSWLCGGKNLQNSDPPELSMNHMITTSGIVINKMYYSEQTISTRAIIQKEFYRYRRPDKIAKERNRLKLDSSQAIDTTKLRTSKINRSGWE